MFYVLTVNDEAVDELKAQHISVNDDEAVDIACLEFLEDEQLNVECLERFARESWLSAMGCSSVVMKLFEV